MVDFGRYSDAELAVMREECDRRSGTADPKSDRVADVRCARCEVVLTYAGTKKFHEGTRWGILGDLGELFVNKEQFAVYFCPRCGKVEFFVDGVGEKLRPK
jgi:phage FluMu protein Com